MQDGEDPDGVAIDQIEDPIWESRHFGPMDPGVNLGEEQRTLLDRRKDGPNLGA